MIWHVTFINGGGPILFAVLTHARTQWVAWLSGTPTDLRTMFFEFWRANGRAYSHIYNFFDGVFCSKSKTNNLFSVSVWFGCKMIRYLQFKKRVTWSAEFHCNFNPVNVIIILCGTRLKPCTSNRPAIFSVQIYHLWYKHSRLAIAENLSSCILNMFLKSHGRKS